ncbi:hypothetical protein FACS1894103_0310 [Campylobacterota bacterium]|nr:hypothetical protein FACS1894103_0310 [Campylobacterota bacterium]
MKRAFTLIELIFSVIIIGIVGSISADIIVRVYDQYVVSRDIESGQNNARRVLDQIGALLQTRVKNSTIGRNTTTNSIISITDSGIDTTYNMLEWIGIAEESRRGQHITVTPGAPPLPGGVPMGWSGVAVETNAVETAVAGGGTKYTYTLKTPRSNLNSIAMSIEHDLRVVQIFAPDLFGDKQLVFIFAGDDMRGDTYGDQNGSWKWNPGDLDSSYFQIHTPTAADEMTVTAFNEDRKLPQAAVSASKIKPYFWARSAYAIRVVDGDLILYSGYRPWLGERYDDTYAYIRQDVLMRDVARFVFNETGNVVRLVLCVKATDQVAGNNDDEAVQFCREKVVL